MKTLLNFFLFFVFFIIILVATLLWLVVDKQEIVTQATQINATNAAQSKRLAKRLLYNLKYAKKQVSISLLATEIKGLTALLHRAIPALSIQVRLHHSAAMFKASYQLPKPLDKYYINVNTSLLPSTSGIELTQVNIGRLTISGSSAVWLFSEMADFYAGKGTADKILASIKKVDISPSILMTEIILDKSLMSTKDNDSLLVKIRNDLALLGDATLVNFYYTALVKHAAMLPETISLNTFIHHLFSLAVKQNRRSIPYSYVKQNEAILVALVLYFGANSFELLVDNVKPLGLEAAEKRYNHREKVLLAGRNDLQKHFVYSIALQLLSDNNTSDALGEFKEFLDSNKGGSGFSFVDLLADRAGTRLAMIVTHSEVQAKAVQLFLASIHEGDLLPSIDQLEEGIAASDFNKTYQGVSSSSYNNMLNILDSKLKKLPLYQFDWQ